jgi:hypothetical protein
LVTASGSNGNYYYHFHGDHQMIAALLGWTKLPQWGMELVMLGIVASAVAGGVLYWNHHLIDEGVAKQKAADDAATATLQATTKTQTAALLKRATTAEQLYASEQTANQNYVTSHPLQPVRMCINSHNSRGVMPQAGTPKPGDASTGAGPQLVQSVPAGDSGSGPGAVGVDIAPLLNALGIAADKVSAQLREYQSR